MDDFFIIWAILIFLAGFVFGYLTREKISRDRRRRLKSLERLSKIGVRIDADQPN
jgi:hypothetical protein